MAIEETREMLGNIATVLLWLMSLVGFATWTVVLTVVLYILCHIGLAKIKEKF